MKVNEFYDELSEKYHLIAKGWDEVVLRQGKVIDQLIRSKTSGDSQNISVLDCSCGIGTQAIGLSKQGYIVTGTDISIKEIERAKAEAKRLGVKANFFEADFTNLENINKKFDIVLSFDNAVAHLNGDKSLEKALFSMKSRLEKGGVLLVSLRDYERIRKERPSGMMPRLIRDEYGERVYFQTWDWAEDGSFYDMALHVSIRQDDKWVSKPINTRMYAHLLETVEKLFVKVGLSQVDVIYPSEDGFYQPVVAGINT